MNQTSDPIHTKFERLLSKSLTTLEVMSYYLVVHTGPGVFVDCLLSWLLARAVIQSPNAVCSAIFGFAS